MTNNLYEFLGMASFVSAATFFVVGLRWSILKMGQVGQGEEKSGNYIQNK